MTTEEKRVSNLLRVKRYQKRNREKVLARRRELRAANPERLAAENKRRAEAKRAWMERDWQEHPEKYRERQDQQIERFPERRDAAVAVRRAVKSGELMRPEACSHCGVTCTPHAHHDDYGKPLDVRWLCVRCHRRHHSPNWKGY
jgi:hypothetical protein